MDNIFEKQFHIRSRELDVSRKLRVTALLDYLQDAADDHASRLGVAVTDLAKFNAAWVISRYHMKILKTVGSGSLVRVRTWPSTRDGVTSCREFEIFIDDTPIALASSLWAAVDLTTRNPVRLDDHIPYFPLLPQRVMAGSFPLLPRMKQIDTEMLFPVRWSDLDVNRHVNNVVYAEWALETVPTEVSDACRLAEIEITYRGEAFYGETVIARSVRVNDDPSPTFIHQLVNQGNGKELTRLRTRWQPAGK